MAEGSDPMSAKDEVGVLEPVPVAGHGEVVGWLRLWLLFTGWNTGWSLPMDWATRASSPSFLFSSSSSVLHEARLTRQGSEKGKKRQKFPCLSVQRMNQKFVSLHGKLFGSLATAEL